ncbi:MAG TPA: SAM-dependent methyltransferase, partial [Rhodospirillaceae bacterium]|nr:SAM-dependent methyltransferase [Rhodospirillaceae bacterium]
MSGAINLEGRLRAGSLEIDLPDGRTVRLTGKQDGPSARLTLHRWRALRRFFGGGTVGFGES